MAFNLFLCVKAGTKEKPLEPQMCERITTQFVNISY